MCGGLKANASLDRNAFDNDEFVVCFNRLQIRNPGFEKKEITPLLYNQTGYIDFDYAMTFSIAYIANRRKRSKSSE